jgi:hypothetical protein
MTNQLDDTIRTSLLAFAMKSFAHLNVGKELVVHDYVRFLVGALAAVLNSEGLRLLLTLPPRHLKTFLASICLPPWILAHRPSAKILLLSYGQDLADKNAFAVRTIMRSAWYQRIFKTRIAKDRSKLTDFVTTAGGYVRSISIEGGVTGLGGDYIIADDLVQIADCDNVKQLEHVNDIFDSLVRTRLDNPSKGVIVIVAHRLAEHDLPGHVLMEGGWEHVCLPLIAQRSRTYETEDGFVWRRKRGDLLRPDAFTHQEIERLKTMRRPDFETLQQQNPGARDRLRIKPEHFGVFVPARVPSDRPVVLSIDPGQQRTNEQLQRRPSLGPARGAVFAAGFISSASPVLAISRRSPAV